MSRVDYSAPATARRARKGETPMDECFGYLTKIDRRKFETLYRLPCPVEDICAYFVCTKEQLEDWCLFTYEMSLDEKMAQGEAIARIRLRQMQRDAAVRNATLTIWLGRQYLGQTNDPASRTPRTSGSDRLWEAIAKSFNMDEDFTEGVD
jgi:hypothetical protein